MKNRFREEWLGIVVFGASFSAVLYFFWWFLISGPGGGAGH
jgi:hypothetical protein